MRGAPRGAFLRRQGSRPQGNSTQLVIGQGDVAQRHISCIFDRVVVRDGVADVGGIGRGLLEHLNGRMRLHRHCGTGFPPDHIVPVLFATGSGQISSGHGRILQRAWQITLHHRVGSTAGGAGSRCQGSRPQGDSTELVIGQGDVAQRHISCIFDRVVVRDGVADVGGIGRGLLRHRQGRAAPP